MKVYVYMKLKLKMWSVKALEGVHKGLVIHHSERITLKDCTFKVSEAGRQRVLKEKQKNVHAGIVGTLVSLDCDTLTGQHITYDPYKYDSFVDGATGSKVTSAALMVGHGRRFYSI